jgi:hypothetical protein
LREAVRGARTALATLWIAEAETTTELITEFYRQLQDPTLSKAVALQRAPQKKFGIAWLQSPQLLGGLSPDQQLDLMKRLLRTAAEGFDRLALQFLSRHDRICFLDRVHFSNPHV